MKTIFLVTIMLTFLNAEYINKNSKEQLRDTKTNLIWQENDTYQEMNWTKAISYCEDLVHDSYSDWRLPKIEELNSIVGEISLEDSESSYFWSSTTFAGGNIFAWHADLKSGYVNINVKKDTDKVRCVR